MSQDIRALLGKVANEDMQALGDLYDQLSVRVFNYARTITQSREMAEDITHDVFLQINRNAARIAKAADPVAYMMAATRNRCYDLLRRGRREAPLEDSFGAGVETPGFDEPLFEEAFAALPVNQREVAYLHLICGFTHKEAAQIQNAPLVTVKWRYGKALEQLKAYFTENETEGNHYAT